MEGACARFPAMTTQGLGRPPATSHAAIEAAAFALFEERGFEETTMDDIAAAVGVGRRTLFRYYPSKNDILWGQFDESLRGFRMTFDQISPDIPLFDAITKAVTAFNAFDRDALSQHRRRMRLLLGTPALLAHSELRYAAWRSVVADFAAQRLGQQSEDLIPSLTGRVALAVALTAYEQWLPDDAADLPGLIEAAAHGMSTLIGRLSADSPLDEQQTCAQRCVR